MYPTKMPSAPQRSGFAQSIDGVASVIAIILAFFLAPLWYGATIVPVTDFTSEHYGANTQGLATLLWMVASGLFVYFSIRAAATVALMRLGIASLMGR